MKRAVSILIILLAIHFHSCELRPLEDGLNETATIPILIDWSKADLDPDKDKDDDLYSASVWLFAKEGTPFDGRSYREYRLDNPRGGYISAPVGKYSVIVFNNSISEFSSDVGFRGVEKYETFEYFAKVDSKKADEVSYIREPDVLASWHTDEIEVTRDMVSLNLQNDASDSSIPETRGILTSITPTRLTYSYTVVANVRELRSSNNAGCELSGCATSVFLGSGKTSATSGTHSFMLPDRAYDPNSVRHGKVSGTFTSFGPSSSSGTVNIIDIAFTLIKSYNGSTTYPTPPEPPFRFNITDQMPKETAASSWKFEISLGVGIEIGETDIDLPRFSFSGDFDTDVGDWEQEDDIDVPINRSPNGKSVNTVRQI